MAEDLTKTTTTETKDDPAKKTDGKPEESGKQPTLDEVLGQLAQLKAENAKLKKKSDADSAEAAEYKRKYRATQTVDEQKKEEEEAAAKAREEETEKLRNELNHMKAVAAYKSIADEKTVDLLIGAVSDGDHAAIATILENEKNRAVKDAVNAAKAEWQRNYPQAGVGTGDGTSVTRADLEKMSYQKRAEFQVKNPEAYEKLMGR